MTTGGYLQSYATNPDGPVGLSRGPVLLAVAGSAATWLLFTLIGARVSDRIGRRSTYLIGWVLLLAALLPLFPLVDTATCADVLRPGPADRRPRLHLRPPGRPLRRALPGVDPVLRRLDLLRDRRIIGGAFAPTIAAALMRATGTTTSIVIYLAIMAAISLVATLTLRDRTGIPLGPDHEAQQSISPIRGMARA